jgi:hypothetical protein
MRSWILFEKKGTPAAIKNEIGKEAASKLYVMEISKRRQPWLSTA